MGASGADEGEHHEVFLRREGGRSLLRIGTQSIAFAADSSSPEQHILVLGEGLDSRRLAVQTYAQGEQITVFAPQGSATLTEVDDLAHAGEGAPSGGRLTAPMPGKLVALLVKAGDAVKAGQTLAVMEAMKMEHSIAAPRDGVVAELLYAVPAEALL